MPELKTMTVGELRAALARFDDQLPVVCAAPAGDYWRNTLALEVRELDVQTVDYSAYHQAFKLPREDDGDASCQGTRVLVLE